MNATLIAFRERILALSVFSIAFRNVPLEGTNKMQVPFFPLETSASVDFVQANGYVFADAYTQETREVTINKRKYQPLSFNSAQFNREPQLNPEQIGTVKGWKLAEDVLADILSIVTLANFGAAEFVGVSSLFDFTVLNETLGTAADLANWPNSPRNAVLSPAYYRNVVTDLRDASATASPDPVRAGSLPPTAGFDLFNTNSIPGNGEDLVGFIVNPSAILIGFSPVVPKDDKNVVDYETLSDDSGITIEFRQWFEPQPDKEFTVLEVNYGFGLGDTPALKRITSI